MRVFRPTLVLAGLALARVGNSEQTGRIDPPKIQMDIKGSETRCLADSVRAGADTSFTYRFVPPKDGPPDFKVQVKLEDPNAKKTTKMLKEEKETFLISKENGGGTCRVCFQNLMNTPARVELVETTVFQGNGPHDEVKQHLIPAYDLLKYAKELSNALLEQQKEGLRQEGEGINEDRSLRSHINMLACFSVIVLFSVSSWQLILLNNFFRSKKLI